MLMRRKEQYKHLLNYTADILVIAFEALCFAVLWHQIYSPLMDNPFHERGHWAVISLYVLVIFFFTKVFGGFQIAYLRVTDIYLAHVLAIGFSSVVAYPILVLACQKYVPIQPLAALTIADCVAVFVWICLVRIAYKRLYPPRQVLVVYGDYPPDELIAKINSRRDKYNICASVSYKIGHEKLYLMAKDYGAVVLCDLPSQVRNQIAKYCFQESIRVYVTPKISDILVSAADDIHLFDTPLLLMRNQGLTIEQRFFKRIEDLIISILGIVVTAPLLLVIAAAIKLYDGGPVFYKQKRYTRDEAVFDILKFRSMAVHEESRETTTITQKKDKRVTPVGKVLRATHLDELPQLFNILKGEMSVVGPRAEWVNTSDRYIEIVPEFIFRLKVKAGLTGYAQVYGKYTTTPYDKVKLDITYIQNYSIWMDFKLILLTVKILFDREKTQGMEGDQKTAIREGKHEKQN